MLCSNVDSVLIVQALGAGEVLLDRVARSLMLALDCDAEPVVVLTKPTAATPMSSSAIWTVCTAWWVRTCA